MQVAPCIDPPPIATYIGVDLGFWVDLTRVWGVCIVLHVRPTRQNGGHGENPPEIRSSPQRWNLIGSDPTTTSHKLPKVTTGSVRHAREAKSGLWPIRRLKPPGQAELTSFTGMWLAIRASTTTFRPKLCTRASSGYRPIALATSHLPFPYGSKWRLGLRTCKVDSDVVEIHGEAELTARKG